MQVATRGLLNSITTPQLGHQSPYVSLEHMAQAHDALAEEGILTKDDSTLSHSIEGG